MSLIALALCLIQTFECVSPILTKYLISEDSSDTLSASRLKGNIWVISPSHSKNMLVLVKFAILQSLSVLAA